MPLYKKLLLELLLIFAVLNIFFLLAKNIFLHWGVDNNLLLAENTILFITGIIIFMLQRKALQNSNPNVFIRSVMAGMLIKMGVCTAAVILYVVLNKENINTIAVLSFMLLYIIYLIAEVAAIMKLNKRSNG